jgi:hypothetical protein
MVMRLQFYVNIENDKIELSINCSKLGVKSKVWKQYEIEDENSTQERK